MSTSSSKFTGAPIAIAKYLAEDEGIGRDLSTIAGYYAEDRFAPESVLFRPDQIIGRAPAAMGLDLSMGITVEQFTAIAESINPATGERLARHRATPVYELNPDTGNPRRDDSGKLVRKIDPATGHPAVEDNHLVGIDVVFSPPKSLTLLVTQLALTNPAEARRVLAALDGVARRAAERIENEDGLGRRSVQTPTEAGERRVKVGERRGEICFTEGSDTVRVPVDLLMFQVRQHTARPTYFTESRGVVPDPQLHWHTYISPVGYDAETNTWRKIDEFALKDGMQKRDVLYKSDLAKTMEDLGYGLDYADFDESRKGRMSWEVKGITDEAIRHYSSNSEKAHQLAVELEAKTDRPVTPLMVNAAMKGSRIRKNAAAKAQDSHPDAALWHADAERCGITIATNELIGRLDGQQTVAVPSEKARREAFYDRLYGPKGLAMKDATFDGKWLSQSVARCAEGLRFSRDEVADLELELITTLPTISRGADRPPLYTTSVQLTMEHFVADTLAEKATRRYQAASSEQLEAAIASQPVPLDAEQVAMVRASVDGRAITFVEGEAGTGKTTALRAAVQALRTSGAIDNVVTVSTAALTAGESGRKLGADYAGSVESLAVAASKGRVKLTNRTLVVFDEFAMCDTARQAQFLKTIGPARVIYVGDPEQAQAIGPGGWDREAVRIFDRFALAGVHRQKDFRDTKDYRLVRAGNADIAVKHLAARGRVHIDNNAQSKVDRVMRSYQQFRGQGYSVGQVRILMDGANKELDVLNRAVQRYQREHGDLAAAETGMTVEATDEGRHWTLHAGDRVVFLTGYAKNGGPAVKNGTLGQILKLDAKTGRAVIRTDAGAKVRMTIPPRMGRQTLGLGYAMHTYKFQGNELAKNLYLPGPAGVTDKHLAYSSLTRATEESHIFLDRDTHGEDPIGAITKAWTPDQPKETARSLHAEAALRDTPVPEGRHFSAPVVGGQPEAAGDDRTPAHARPPVVSDGATHRQQVDGRRAQRLERVVGPELGARLRADPAYPVLAAKLNGLHHSGANADAMLRKVVGNRELDTAKNPAAALCKRLGTTQRIERSDRAENLSTRGLTENPQNLTIAQRAAIDDTPLSVLDDRAHQAKGQDRPLSELAAKLAVTEGRPLSEVMAEIDVNDDDPRQLTMAWGNTPLPNEDPDLSLGLEM